MSFTQHKVLSFAHKIADLPDQPTMPASELKARFDACPEQLRRAHNALCDEADALDARVQGILTQSFGQAVSKPMLSPALADELDAKASQSALIAETTARVAADSALSDRLGAVETQKCEVRFGSYTGDGALSRTIALGFTPKAILTSATTARDSGNSFYDGLALPGKPVRYSTSEVLAIVENGFSIRSSSYTECTNKSGIEYNYIAFK